MLENVWYPVAAFVLGTVLGVAGSWWLCRYRERAESRSRETVLHALARAARILFSAGGNDRVLSSALAVLGESVGADRVYVFENHRDPASGELLASMRYEWCRPGVSAQIGSPDMQGMSYDRLIPDWRPLFEAREPVVGLVDDMPAAERELLRPQDILSILVVPIFLDGMFWGLIGFDDCSTRRRWQQAEIHALEVAAGTIGGAIRSVRAEEELRRLVSTDSLTGVCSRRAFLERAGETLEATRRDGKLALVIMDLDRFKRINDRYGHPAGDAALRAFADICREVLRHDDLIGRTGGEEFAVLLRDVDPQRAAAVADKLRRRVREAAPHVGDDRLELSVSIGVAMVPPHARSLNGLLKQADKALYAAKRNGRDRVELAD